MVPGGDGKWNDSTRAEALFGLKRFSETVEPLARVREKTKQLWRLEATAMQLGGIARLRHFEWEDAGVALKALLGEQEGAIRRACAARSGSHFRAGGFRASLFDIGVLARLAECNVLRHVEVLSWVSGGSIVGAHYYLKLRELLQGTDDGEIEPVAYVKLVEELARKFLEGVQTDVGGICSPASATTCACSRNVSRAPTGPGIS